MHNSQKSTLKYYPWAPIMPEREPKRYINELIVETEVAICQLDPKLQNTYQHLAAKQIKYILATNRYNVFHKCQQHYINQIKKVLENNNLTIAKVDKSKAIVIINKDKLNNKVNNFIKENHMKLLNKDPTEIYIKKIHQTIQKCNTLRDKQTHRYLLNLKPKAPQLNIYLKTHKDNQPIRSVINNIQAPSYKVPLFVNKRLQELLHLLYEYNTKNSQQVAEELIKLQINKHMRLITLDIKDMYVNLPITGIIQTASFWLNKHNNTNRQLSQQILNMLNTTVKQNYFQYQNQIFQLEKGIAMGSPISGIIAEIFLQHLENMYIKHSLDSKEITFYKRYVDDILILYDQQNIDEHMILHKINGVDKNLQFKVST
jgi:hypothetical protein